MHDTTNCGVDGGTVNERVSHTTASRSDLSIDEINLMCYKEYMLYDDVDTRTKPPILQMDSNLQ